MQYTVENFKKCNNSAIIQSWVIYFKDEIISNW
jgi:hypothetical protein